MLKRESDAASQSKKNPEFPASENHTARTAPSLTSEILKAKDANPFLKVPCRPRATASRRR